MFAIPNVEQDTCDDKRDYQNHCAVRRIIKARCGGVFRRSLGGGLLISYRIKPIEGFDTVSMNTPPTDDAPTGCRQANNLRRLGVFNGALDIDFQGIEAKINITDSRVNHCDCAVMFGPCYAVAVERLFIDGFFVGAATAQEGGCGENKE